MRERAARAIRWPGVLVVASVTALGLSGCGDDGTSDGDMVLSMSFTPNPTTGVASELEGFDFVAPYQVSLRETGGLGGAISDVNINVYQVVDGEPGDLAESTRSLLEYETTRLEAGGTLDLQFNTHYALLNEGSAAFIDVFIFFTDDNFFTQQVGGRLTVQ